MGVHEDGKTVCGGDNQGTVAIHHLDSGNTEKHELHTNQIKHLEFSTRFANTVDNQYYPKQMGNRTVRIADFSNKRTLTKK